MAQNEKNRMTSSGQEDIQNQDQTSQRRETDLQNARSGQNNSNRNDNDDRGISGLSSGAINRGTNEKMMNSGAKKDSMDLNKQNIPG